MSDSDSIYERLTAATAGLSEGGAETLLSLVRILLTLQPGDNFTISVDDDGSWDVTASMTSPAYI